MASVANISRDIENIVIPLLKEILEKINSINADSTKDIVEAAAAKVISEITKCPCNKEIIDAINSSTDLPLVITGKTEEPDSSTGKNQRLYSFPNYNVGNEELGTGKNLNSLTWPFGSNK